MKIAILVMVIWDWRIGFAQPTVAPGPSPLGTAPAVLLQPAGKAAEVDPTVSPGFVVIDQFDASSHVGIQMSYLEPNPQAFSGDPTVRRFEAHARHVDKAIGLGGYLQVPFAYASETVANKTQTITDFGDHQAKDWQRSLELYKTAEGSVGLIRLPSISSSSSLADSRFALCRTW